MSKLPINTTAAPPPRVGIYNQAIVAGGFVFCSGALPADATGKMIEGDIEAKTHQCIKNFAEVLKAAGSSIDLVVKVNIYLTDMSSFDKMNEVYKSYWGEIKPSRTCVVVKELPRGSPIEMECTAILADVPAKL